jgi:hypothetical protein
VTSPSRPAHQNRPPLDRLQAPFRDDLSPAITGRWHPRPINQTVGPAQLGELPSVAFKRRIRHRRRTACPVCFGFISRVAFGEIDRAPARWRDVIQQLLEQCVRSFHHHRVLRALAGSPVFRGMGHVRTRPTRYDQFGAGNGIIFRNSAQAGLLSKKCGAENSS